MPASTLQTATEATNEVTGTRSRSRPRVQILKKAGNPVNAEPVNESPRRQLEVVSAPRREIQVDTIAPRRELEVVTAPRRQFNVAAGPRRIRPTGKRFLLYPRFSLYRVSLYPGSAVAQRKLIRSQL